MSILKFKNIIRSFNLTLTVNTPIRIRPFTCIDNVVIDLPLCCADVMVTDSDLSQYTCQILCFKGCGHLPKKEVKLQSR